MIFKWKLPPYIDQKDSQDHKKLLAALQQHPEDAIHLHGLILHITFPSVNHDQCIASADYLIAHAKDNENLFWANYYKACILEHRKDYQQALEGYKKAMRYDEEDADDMLGAIAGMYSKLYKFDDALECYFKYEVKVRKDLQEYDEEFDAYDLYDKIGEVYFNKREYDKALEYFYKSLEIKKDSTVALCGIGRALAMKGENDEALKYFTDALAINPKDAYIIYYIGQVWQYKGDFYRAMHHYSEALKIKPDMAIVYNNIGALLLNEEGDVKGAISNMVEAVEHSKPGDKHLTLFYQNLAKLHHKIADYDKANYYTMKMMETLGFPTELSGLDDDGDDD